VGVEGLWVWVIRELRVRVNGCVGLIIPKSLIRRYPLCPLSLSPLLTRLNPVCNPTLSHLISFPLSFYLTLSPYPSLFIPLSSSFSLDICVSLIIYRFNLV
jgi:hypothetical protein